VQGEVMGIASKEKMQSYIEDVEEKDFSDAEELIFMLVKRGHISLGQFRELCRLNEE
jgi:hypothetical protein